jgi:hypothetical protein
MKNKHLSENEEVIKDMSKLFLFWLGIIICLLSVAGFFVSSEWIAKNYLKTISDYSGNDSNASSFLVEVEIFFLKVASWLKKLPIWAKIVGVVVGGIMAAANHEDD